MKNNNQFSQINNRTISLPENIEIAQKCYIYMINHFKDIKTTQAWFESYNESLQGSPTTLLQKGEGKRLLEYIELFYLGLGKEL